MLVITQLKYSFQNSRKSFSFGLRQIKIKMFIACMEK